MIPQDYNIVVVGLGTIGQFLLPGYEMLLGDRVSANVYAVKATDRNLEKLRESLPFKISVDNLPEILRKTHPDIVIMCPTPKQIPGIAKDILQPYFTEARTKGISLPDIYTFGPSPDPRFYYELLGEDINCVKYLPSMAEPFKGVPLQKIGPSFLSFVPEYPFPEDRKQRAIDFSNLFGKTFLLEHQQSLVGLSAKNTAHTCFEISYAIADAMKAEGYAVDTSNVGSALRAAMREHVGLSGEGLYPCSLKDVPEEIRGFVGKLSVAWYEGILKYIVSTGVNPQIAEKFHQGSFESWTLTIQLASREELEATTKRHATKGGVNEKAINVFMSYFESNLKSSIKKYLNNQLDPSFFDTAEGLAYTINLTVNRHSHRLADKG